MALTKTERHRRGRRPALGGAQAPGDRGQDRADLEHLLMKQVNQTENASQPRAGP